jgi:hypothetical protein
VTEPRTRPGCDNSDMNLMIGLSAHLVLSAHAVHATPDRILVDPGAETLTIKDGAGDLALRLRYGRQCAIDRLVVRGRKVGSAWSGAQSGSAWVSTQALAQSPRIAVSGRQVRVTGIDYRVDRTDVDETWTFTVESNRIEWAIDRQYAGSATLNDTAMPEFRFKDASTWKGGMTDNGGVVVCKYLSGDNASLSMQTGGVTLWNPDTDDCLKISSLPVDGAHTAVKFTHLPDGAFSTQFSVKLREFVPKHGLARYRGNQSDIWQPFDVSPGHVSAKFALQAEDYRQAYDRGTFPGMDGDSIREMLNTVARYGVIDDKIMGANGWLSGYVCLHEQWFAQMGAVIDDPDYTRNLTATLDDERRKAIKPDGRVLSRWDYYSGDAMPGTYEPTGYYECQWGYTLDSQPDYVMNVCEQFDQTGDLGWLKNLKPACESALDYLLRRADKDGLVRMMSDSYTQGRASDWDDTIFASWKNGLVNAELYGSLTMWARLERLLHDADRANGYAEAAAKIKASFNKPIADGGLWDPAKGWYAYWREADNAVHGDNLVIPVNFAAIAYGLCDDPQRQTRILSQLEAHMRKEDLFSWPLCIFPFEERIAPNPTLSPANPQLIQPFRLVQARNSFPFPRYENGDLFLSWGELGVRSYAQARPEIAVAYVRRLLSRYRKDSLAFQRYLRQSQAGAGDDVLAGNCLALVGLFRDVYGVRPEWNRLYLEPHLTPELSGTKLNYLLRGQKYEIGLKMGRYSMSVDGFAVSNGGPFALSADKNTASFYPRHEDSPKLTVTRSKNAPVSVVIEGFQKWDELTSARSAHGPVTLVIGESVQKWTESSPEAGVRLRYLVSGLRPSGAYRLSVGGKRTARLHSDSDGRLEFATSPTTRGREVVLTTEN